MTVLQALTNLHERLQSDGRAPAFGFSRENISFAIVLALDGTPIDTQDLRDVSGKSPKPRRCEVARPVKRTGQLAPNFLWDKCSFALGVKRDAGTRNLVRADGEHAAFKDFHCRLLAQTDDRCLQAFLRFLGGWRNEQFGSLRYADKIADGNVVFRLDGTKQFVHMRDSARSIWLDHLRTQGGDEGLCLVTGEHAPIARLHPSVKGIAGAQSSGASLVSFDKDAFKSFGKERGANAPISEPAAFAYTASLNSLLERDSGQRIQIGDTTTVFWAESAGGGAQAVQAESLFSLIANPPPPTDSEESAKISDKLTAIAEGRPLAELEPDLDKNTRFFVLGLAPNAARVSIRFWHEGTIGEIARRVAEHWSDLRLEPTPWQAPPSARHLLRETAVQRKTENIPPTLGGALMRAILVGSHYPRSLLAAIIIRLRADRADGMLGRRIALLKAYLRRAQRLSNSSETTEDGLVSLDPASDNVAYNLGRLFAAYAYAERSFAKRNQTIRDKLMAAASSTPRRVFPILMRGYEHNRSGLDKGDKMQRGAGKRADQAVVDIVERLSGRGELPASLPLEDQARFFVGYYHQERAFYTKSDSDQGRDIESPEEA